MCTVWANLLSSLTHTPTSFRINTSKASLENGCVHVHKNMQGFLDPKSIYKPVKVCSGT